VQQRNWALKTSMVGCNKYSVLDIAQYRNDVFTEVNKEHFEPIFKEKMLEGKFPVQLCFVLNLNPFPVTPGGRSVHEYNRLSQF
jgi:hypothetical protein